MKCPACGHVIVAQEPLSLAQRRVYLAIRKYERDHGMFPSMQDVADAMGWASLGTAHEALAHLARKGWIIRVLAPCTGRAYLTHEKMAAMAQKPAQIDVKPWQRRRGGATNRPIGTAGAKK